ncbi:MAG: thymidine phosphorylase [Chloroflexia bacterium]
MNVVDIIAAKRDGRELSAEEIDWLVKGFTGGDVPDYQVAAWLMAARIRGMTPRETTDLTRAMVESGRSLDLSAVAPFVADKHSTGGVGDKTTLVVAPLVAATGLPVGKMSGRGLGFSGGTLDKLESIPGFRTGLSVEEFKDAIARVGLVVASQSADLAPADGKLYALRDVTATVDSIPLIASSIMSKKLAAGANAVVLDVKVGRGAFMKTYDDARSLAVTMRDIGKSFGLQVRAVLSGMDQPLGRAVGNALEIREAVETLQGRGPEDLTEVALTLGAHLLNMAGRASTIEEGVAMLRAAVHSGAGLAKFRDFVANQGGDTAFIDDLSQLPQAPVKLDFPSEAAGYLAALDAETIGRASVDLGAGRLVKGAPIDYAVGFVVHHKIGDAIQPGDTLITIHARTQEAAQQVLPHLKQAVKLSPTPVTPPPTVLEVVT